MKRRTVRRNKISLYGWRALLTGVGVGIAALILTSLLATLLCYLSGDPLSYSDLASLIALLVGGAVSGFITPRLTEDGAILPAILSALLLPLLMLLLGLILSGGELAPKIPLNYLCYFGISSLSSLFSRRLLDR